MYLILSCAQFYCVQCNDFESESTNIQNDVQNTELRIDEESTNLKTDEETTDDRTIQQEESI